MRGSAFSFPSFSNCEIPVIFRPSMLPYAGKAAIQRNRRLKNTRRNVCRWLLLGKGWKYYLFAAFLLAALFLPEVLWAQEERRPLTLPEVVQHVLLAHPLTQAAAARVQTALGLLRQAGAYPNPTFTFEDNDPSREHTYTLRQPLEWPFKRSYRISVAAADERIAESEQSSVRQDLIAAAREAFFRLLLAQENFQNITAFVATTEQLLHSTTRLFQEGDAPEFDVTKARVEALRVATEAERLRGQVVAARAALNLLLEREEGRPVTLTGSLSTPPVVPSLEGLTAQAEEQNPQLAVQRQIVERERLNVKLAWSALVPDPAIDIAKRDNLGPGVSGPIIGLSFVVPLWDRKEGAIAAARSRLAAAEATLRANRLQVHQTLLTAYRNWETASGQVTLFSQGLVSQAEEAATLAERRYQEGEGYLLGVLDARRSLLAVRRDYAQALFDRLMAWIALERAAGIGTEH